MTSMKDRLESEISQDVYAAINKHYASSMPAELEAVVDDVMRVIAGRARSIHLAFPQDSGNVTFTTTAASWPS